MKKKLALFGGKKTVNIVKPYISIGHEEKIAVNEVLDTNCLSGFYGSWTKEFFGGEKIKLLENKWKKFFGVKNAISVNSNTSGLFCAMGAIGISPGDEVIVPPTTMSATAMAPLVYGGIPVFADIEEKNFCIDPAKVEEKINKRTKAIIAVNLFGHPAQLKKLKIIAKRHNVYLIEDNAQAPLATENGKFCGTVGDIGVFSLNYHKHIHSGEGGICCTDNDELALKMQLIRNHAEASVEFTGIKDITNMIGYNYRMTEMSAAIAIVQLKNIKKHVELRKSLSEELSSYISGLPGLTSPLVRKDCSHVYYGWVLDYDEKHVGVKRDLFVEALNAEGFPCYGGYCKPLYLLPVFQNRKAIGRNNFPFNLTKIEYTPGLCPIAERLHKTSLIVFQPCAYDISKKLIKEFGKAINKVYKFREELIKFKN